MGQSQLCGAQATSAGVDRCSPSLSQSGGEMTHLWSPWRGSCTRQGGQHTVEARSQADPLSHCAALCRPCCTTAAACPHHRRHCPHAGAGYLDARQRAKLTRSVVNSAKKTCVLAYCTTQNFNTAYISSRFFPNKNSFRKGVSYPTGIKKYGWDDYCYVY